MAYKHDAEHVAKNVTNLTGFYVNMECFSLNICFKVTFDAMIYILKLITITFVIINYEVKYLFLCRDVIFNEILGISYFPFSNFQLN